jgi:hypothetical protein
MANDPHDARTPGRHQETDHPDRAGHEEPETELERTLDTEHALVRHIAVDIAIAVPVAIGILVGMVALAVSVDGAALEAPILMAVGIGTLAGVFFGTWAGFVSTAHAFEELDRMHRPTP